MTEYLCAECGDVCRPRYEDQSGVSFPEHPEFVLGSSCCMADIMDDTGRILTAEEVAEDMEAEAWFRQEYEADTSGFMDVFGGKV